MSTKYIVDGIPYTNKGKTPSHHGWAWIIVIIIIVVILVILYFAPNWRVNPSNENYGEYSDPIVGVCTGSDSCTNPGVQTVIQECIPNSVTNRGCIIPSGPNAGEQTYQPLIEIRSCQPHCVISKWQELDAEPCLVKLPFPDLDLGMITEQNRRADLVSNTSIEQCVPNGTLGSRARNFQCVANDSTGTNQCTAYQFGDFPADSIAGLTGNQLEVNGITELNTIDDLGQYTVRTYQIGDIVTIDEPCLNFNNPICGDWSIVDPVPPDQPVKLDDSFTISACALGSNLRVSSACVVDLPPLGTLNDNIWNFLREGYVVNPLSCVFTENSDQFGVTPDVTDPVSPDCLPLEAPTCLDIPISSQQVIDGTLPTVNDQVQNTVCSTNSINPSENNPSCYQTCRLQVSNQATTDMFIDATDNDIGFILDKILSFRWPTEQLFLSLSHIPCDKPIPPMGFCNIDINTNGPLLDVSTEALDFTTAPGCTEADVEFNTSLLTMIGARSYDSVTKQVKGQILSSISTYLGWLSANSGTMIWKQAYNEYQGNGISSANVGASQYNISVVQPFNAIPPPGFPTGTLGTIQLSIQDSNGNSIQIPTSNGVVTMDNVEAIVYDPNTVMFESRSGQCLLL